MNYDFLLVFEQIIRLMSAFETDSPQKRRQTSSMWLLLKFIQDKDQVTGSDVVKRFMIKHPTATQLIDRAESQGFVKRQPSGSDRRVFLLTLTDKGREELLAQGKLYDERASRALQYLTSDERSQLLALLQKMADGLDDEFRTSKIA